MEVSRPATYVRAAAFSTLLAPPLSCGAIKSYFSMKIIALLLASNSNGSVIKEKSTLVEKNTNPI